VKGSIQHYPWLGKFLLLAGIFIVAEVIFSYLAMYLAHFIFPETNFLQVAVQLQNGTVTLQPDSALVHALELYQFITSIGRFLLVPFFFCYLSGESPLVTFGLHKRPDGFQSILVLPIMISSAVVIGFINEWNQGIQFPAFLADMESNMRLMEEQAKNMSDAFLKTSTLGGLLVNMLLIGVVAAISEEIIFRGLLQDMFRRWTGSIHAGIWISAFLFSFIHLQFFGFFPRLLLGALLGYLYAWSGSLWTAILGHFINNTAAVILYFLMGKGMIENDPTEAGTWLQAVLFLPLAASLIWLYRSKSPSWRKIGS
jgi:membrane protease YdiL (CAAX protease family)